MIFVARILSLVGVTVAIVGIVTIALMEILDYKCLLPADFQNYRLPVFFFTILGAVLLLIGQLSGNDLFKVRGKDSIFTLKAGSNRRDSQNMGGGGSGFGGDGGSCD